MSVHQRPRRRTTLALLAAAAISAVAACRSDGDESTGGDDGTSEAPSSGDADTLERADGLDGDSVEADVDALGDPRDAPIDGAPVDGDDSDAGDPSDVPPPLRDPGERYAFANACVTLRVVAADGDTRALVRGDAATYALGAPEGAARFRMRASDLGTFLLLDDHGAFLFADARGLVAATHLESDIGRGEDGFVSPAEWDLVLGDRMYTGFGLRNRATGQWLAATGLSTDAGLAAELRLTPAAGCAEFPEMSLDATGSPARTTWDDGDLFGFADAHAHILSNFGFGGGGIFHGAPFHRLGVEHALGDCSTFHGEGGRSDLLGWAFGSGAASGLDEASLINLLATGALAFDTHTTDGWPTFSGWPSRESATHQTEYYRWIERAWLAGLRLVVQHAVSNEAFCELTAKPGYQPVRWGCEDMLNIDRQLVEIRNMERYIDAQAGGPGLGFFRVVSSPAEAREVIRQGKLAVLLGIEVPNLFRCYLTPRPGGADCTPEYIEAELDRYYAQGVRVLFPNHKFDNAFSPGDGHRGMVELGNFYTTGHWNNFVTDCPDLPSVFDRGHVQFAGFNQPREDYLAPAPNPLLELGSTPLLALMPYVERLRAGSEGGDHCQNAGLTEAGRTLINGMMDRGIIVELDHLPRRAYADAFEMLAAADYPGAGTHGNTNRGRLYALDGVTATGFGRCADPALPGSLSGSFRERRDGIVAAGGYPGVGFSFDLNGLAGVPGPRFGARAGCGLEQQHPVEYPFTSFDGGVTFTQPSMGERQVDFNTEGMIHIGLVAEYVEDARRTGSSDDDLGVLFRSAEAYLRSWEKAELRAAERAAARGAP